MANAICSECGKIVSWRAGRGDRLSDFRCPACGGTLRSKTAERPSPNKGRRYYVCPICKRRRLNVVKTTKEWMLWDGTIVLAGTVVCTNHSVRILANEHAPSCWHSAGIAYAERENKKPYRKQLEVKQ